MKLCTNIIQTLIYARLERDDDGCNYLYFSSFPDFPTTCPQRNGAGGLLFSNIMKSYFVALTKLHYNKEAPLKQENMYPLRRGPVSRRSFHDVWYQFVLNPPDKKSKLYTIYNACLKFNEALK